MSDIWSKRIPSILAEETMARLRTILTDVCPLIVEHRHYHGASAPTRLVFDDPDEFETYLKSKSKPGDSFWIWSYDECCRNDNASVTGKYPNAEGLTPEGGAY